jgi:hypothetical protein
MAPISMLRLLTPVDALYVTTVGHAPTPDCTRPSGIAPWASPSRS